MRRSSVDSGPLDRYIPRRRGSNIDLSHMKLLNQSGSAQSDVDSPRTPTADVAPAVLSPMFQTPEQNSILNISPQVDPVENGDLSTNFVTPNRKPKRCLPTSPQRVLTMPNVINDMYANSFDWSCKDTIAIALEDNVYTWTPKHSSTKVVCLQEARDSIGTPRVTSLAWESEGRHLALGTDNGFIMLWDSETETIHVICEIGDCSHTYSVDALAWCYRPTDNVLFGAQSCGCIRELGVHFKRKTQEFSDVRSSMIRTSVSPSRICGLKVSPLHTFLAFGDNDGKIFIWNVMPESSEPEIILEDHNTPIAALAFCPWQPTLLASAAGADCGSIKGHKVTNGFKLFDIDIPSEVCCIVWCKMTRELICGLRDCGSNPAIRIWSYPSMDLVGCLQDDGGHILYLAVGPDDCTLASVSADESLHLWLLAKKKKVETQPKRKSLQLSSPCSASPLSACIR